MTTAVPYLIQAGTIGEAWADVCNHVLANHNDVRNLLVTISDPASLDSELHAAVDDFCRVEGLLTPKHVAYTIFPKGLAEGRSADELYHVYNRPRGFFERVSRRRRGWGTYFRRMTCYEAKGGRVNQLHRIIEAINKRAECHRAAYTMLIQQPGPDNARRRGGPCLNYIALQLHPGEPRTIGLLAVYRNHDVVERVYGNYLGLAWLLAFICGETGSQVGPLSCLSSRAYVERKVTALRNLLNNVGVS